VALAGCGKAPEPQFQVNLEGRDPQTATAQQVAAVREALEQLFGTPERPAVPAGVPLSLERLAAAAGPVGGQANGRQFGLYRRYCTCCHGVSGTGAGPAAGSLDPYPRDYRNGVFKYTSTCDGGKPTDDDLERTLLRGIPGTAMPSFAKLSPAQIAALVEYVKYLSIRGQTELVVVQLAVDENEPLPLDGDLVRKEALLPAVESWDNTRRLRLEVWPPSRPDPSTPQALAASVAKGREVYRGKAAQCLKCHGPEGRGDGEEGELYDAWNKPKKGATPQETRNFAARFALPIQPLRPRNFHAGIFRGGNGPQDLYLRICVGIKGTPMPVAGPGKSSGGALSPAEMWSLVDYVRSLSEQ
jgi:mono/diheme cytochrome c family protein